MDEEKKFTETANKVTETVTESPLCHDNVFADSEDYLADGNNSTVNEVKADENSAKSPQNHDNLLADSETAPTEKMSLGDKFKRAFTKEVAWSNTKKLANRWFIDAFTGMAQGLFVTLIAGTIFKQIGLLFGNENAFGQFLVLIGNMACMLMGAGIGVGIAKKLKVPDMLIFACAAAGFIGAFLPDAVYKAAKAATAAGSAFDLNAVVNSFTKLVVLNPAKDPAAWQVMKIGLPGNPIGAYVGTLLALEIVRLYCGKTKLDILLVPLGVLILGFVNAFIAVPAVWLVDMIGKGVEAATAVAPFTMGVIISVVMGLLLTMPTSSAAIWISIANVPNPSYALLLAGGAATVGCACQMVGFAFASFKENRYSGLISQGIGTSMLQIPNIMRNGRILIPATVASAICGPISTCLFKLRCGFSGGGMGTSGFVGIIDTLAVSSKPVVDAAGNVIAKALPAWQTWLGIILLMIVLPAVISWAVSVLLRKVGWIKDGDMSLDYDKKYK